LQYEENKALNFYNIDFKRSHIGFVKKINVHIKSWHESC